MVSSVVCVARSEEHYSVRDQGSANSEKRSEPIKKTAHASAKANLKVRSGKALSKSFHFLPKSKGYPWVRRASKVKKSPEQGTDAISHGPVGGVEIITSPLTDASTTVVGEFFIVRATASALEVFPV